MVWSPDAGQPPRFCRKPRKHDGGTLNRRPYLYRKLTSTYLFHPPDATTPAPFWRYPVDLGSTDASLDGSALQILLDSQMDRDLFRDLEQRLRSSDAS